MKMRFLSTTAIVTTALVLYAGSTQGAEKIKIGVGGYFKAYLAAVNQDKGVGAPGQNRRDHLIAREAEIHFKGRTALDNGLIFGVNVQLEAETCSDQIDESFIYVEGGFGKLILGSDDPASDQLYYGTPQPIAGVGVATPDFLFSQLTNSVATPESITSISGDSEKITYFTPRMNGIQLGISYTPEQQQDIPSYSGPQGDADAGDQSEVVEIGANYIRKIGDFNMVLSVGYGQGNLEVAAAGAEDQTQWGLGVEFTYGALTFGGDHRKNNQGTSGANTDRTDYSYGVSYETGDWTLAGGFVHGEVEAGIGLGKDETDGYQVGIAFDVGPGIKLVGGITRWKVADNLNAAASENKSTEFIVGTKLSF